MKILGLDPGKRNAFWVLAAPCGVCMDVLDTGQLDSAPDVKVEQRLVCLDAGVRSLLDQLEVDVVYVERFIARPGMLRGNAAETVNLLIGILWSECRRRHIRMHCIMPSVHKMWIKRRYGGKTAQELFTKLNEHQADALALATYGWSRRGQ